MEEMVFELEVKGLVVGLLMDCVIAYFRVIQYSKRNLVLWEGIWYVQEIKLI